MKNDLHISKYQINIEFIKLYIDRCKSEFNFMLENLF